jgi:glycosyltransferase involved in cell wall biosynthesis
MLDEIPAAKKGAPATNSIRLVVDATAVQEHGGGLTTYATGLIKAWGATFPDDDLVVVAGDPGGARILRDVAADVRASNVSRSRFVAQHALVPLVARKVRPDAMLAMVPSVPLIPVGVPIVSVVYDLRSWIHPEEFPASVRAYRRIAHHYAFHRSARIVTISERSRLDLARVCRRGALKAQVLYPAADHVDAWPRSPRAPIVITFGHWSNKRPGLAIDAWEKALKAGVVDGGPAADWQLHVVGVPAEGREALIHAAAERGVADSVVVHGYLPDPEYQRLFTSATAVLMLSTFEGFGVPVVEAMRLGIHVIASRDPALQEAGGSSAVYVDDEAGLSQALQAVLADHPEVRSMVESGLHRARGMTWASTAAGVRALVQGAITGRDQRGERAA